jgi:putative ABC transport system permease protein
MNTLDILHTAVANTFRSRLRTTLTVAAIFIGACTLTLTNAIGTGISGYLDVQLASVGAPDVLSIAKTADAAPGLGDGPTEYDPVELTAGTAAATETGGSTAVLSPADLDAIAATDGLLDVNPVIAVTPSWIEYDGNGKYNLAVGANSEMTRADLAAGTQLSQSSGANEVLLPASYLGNLGFDDAEAAIGARITLGAADYVGTMHEVTATVAGVQNLTLLGVGVRLSRALTDEVATIEATGKPHGMDTGYFLATAHFDPAASPEQVTALKTDLADQGYTAQTVADQIGVFQTILTGIIGVLNGFAGIALVAAGVGIVNTLLMSVQERTREIGLMKAMGMSGRRVYALFSTEAIFIGFLGSTLGALVAIIVGTIVSAVLSDTILADLEGLQVMQFAPVPVAGIILLVMLIAFLAGTLPARRAARQNPIDALRYE